MGSPVPPTPPSLGNCPDCCSELHNRLYGRLTVPGMEPFVGTLEQDPENPCSFEGLLQDGVNGAIPLFLTFCTDGDKANVICGPPLAAQCGGIIIDDNHCWPWIDKISAGGCRYEVWP